jgi:hypothetical protein
LADDSSTVFISYTHDSPEHAEKVLALSKRLRTNGIDCVLDQYELSPPEGWPLWMDREIKKAKFVLMICTAAYLRRVNGNEEPGIGLGIAWEGNLICNHIYNTASRNTKFIPVVFDAAHAIYVPTPIQGVTRYNLGAPDGYERLYSRLIGKPPAEKPPLGEGKSLPQREVRTTFFYPSPTVATLTKLDLHLREAMDYLQAMSRAAKFAGEVSDEEYSRLCNAATDSARTALAEGRLFIPPDLANECDGFFNTLSQGLRDFAFARDPNTPNGITRGAYWDKASKTAYEELPTRLEQIERTARNLVKPSDVTPSPIATEVSNPLHIEVGEHGPFFSTKGKGLHKSARQFNIKIENVHERRPVTGCKVSLLKIEPHEYTGPWVLKEGFSLAAGDHIFIPLVVYGEAREPKYRSGDSFMVICVPEPSPKPSAHSTHVLTLKATSLDTAPCEFRCKLWVDEAGRLRIEKM